jgi:hypothetical protein
MATHFSGPVDSAGGFSVGGTTIIDSTGAISAAAGSIGSGELDATTIQYAEVSIAAAAIRTLRATPVQLVAAPGAGKFVEFVSAQLFLDYGGAALTESSDNLAVRLNDGSGLAVSETIETTGFIDQTADTITNAIQIKDRIVSKANGENKKLVLHNTGSAEFGTAGTPTSALRVKVAYRVHSTGF